MEAGPVKFSQIDEEMCRHFEQPVDEKRYLGGWYDSIGFRLALGKSFEQIRAEFRGYVDEEKETSNFYVTMLKMLDWLDENYTPDSWREGR
jgi:hypothetical protein